MNRLITLFFGAVLCITPSVASNIPFDGNGTSTSPYILSSPSHLSQLAQLTTDNTFAGVYFALESDIDMSGESNFNGFSANTANGFNGSFDGRNHTIDGVRIHATQPNTGLFGTIGSSATIANLTLGANSSIHGSDNVGGIVGYSDGGTVIGCINHAPVTATGKIVGGIVGNCSGPVKQCLNTGVIQAANNTCGGISGHTFAATEQCVNLGTVTITAKTASTTGEFCGGIAGRANASASSITDCINAGTVTAPGLCGGIAGVMRYVTRCLCYGTVYSDTPTLCGAIAGKSEATFGQTTSDTYYDAQICTAGAVGSANYSGIKGVTTSALTTAALPSGLNTALWQASEGSYPTLKPFANQHLTTLASQAVALLTQGQTAGNVMSNIILSDTDGLTWHCNGTAGFRLASYLLIPPTDIPQGYETLSVSYGNITKSIRLWKTGETATTTGPFAGSGTQSDPFLIQTKDDLIKLSQLTSTQNTSEAASKETFDGQFFLMTNDIDLEYDTRFMGISSCSSFLVADRIRFCGVFDGGDHAIHRMKIGKVAWVQTPQNAADGLGTVDNGNSWNYTAFIGRLGNGGTVRNLNIAADCDLVGYSSHAAIVGVMTDGSAVRNCRNYANVTSYSSLTGGIAADMLEGSTIRDCYNAGRITTALMIAGGIAGRSAGRIERCANAGEIIATHLTTNIPTGQGFFCNAGGIVGDATASTAAIVNCVNAGTVRGEEEVGGICGTFGATSSVLNHGIIISTNVGKSGNLYGNKSKMSGKFPDKSYYDCKINRVRAVSVEDFSLTVDGASIPVTLGTETTELLSGDPLDGLSTSIWHYTQGSYPTLTQFADEPLLNAARKMTLLFGGNNNAAMTTQEIGLHGPENIKWVGHKYFRIEDDKAYPLANGEGQILAIDPVTGHSKMFTCVIYGQASLNQLDADTDATITSRTFHNLQGLELSAEPNPGSGIHIVTTHYSNGHTTVAKIMF